MNKLNKAYESVKSQIGDFIPQIAIILGSGLGALADEIDTVAAVDYWSIEGFPQSTVPGHKGRFVFGHMGDAKVVIMQGRVHYYEGYEMSDVVMPVRLMKLLGAEILFLTNASGGISLGAGEFMLITDQISTFIRSPLIGANLDQFGVRFPDMSAIYDSELNSAVRAAAKELSIPLKEGVYIQTTGPNFESPAEVKMLKVLGADAVGMSTACEAIVANHAGMRICGVSCVANLACGLSDSPLTHQEVMEAADKAAPAFKSLIHKSVENIVKL